MKKLRVALIYNAYTDSQPDEKADTGSLHYLRQMIRGIARGLRARRHEVVDHYRRYRETLRTELGLDPPLELRSLYARLIA